MALPRKPSPRQKASPQSVVIIRWFDSCVDRGECAAEELEGIAEMETAGWLVRQDERQITVALDWNGTSKHWRFAITIPRVNVRSIRKLN
jgi:hypothetical protein